MALYIGLMSGTSMDGVDAALVDFAGKAPHLVASHCQPMTDEVREALLRLATDRSPHPLQCLGELDHLLGEQFARATNALLRQAKIDAAAIRAIGSHGQTLYHRPDGPTPFTLQIGDPNHIAERTGITTVADFRRRDMAAGGQGAPLAPAFHAAVLAAPDEERAVLNLGGIANLTLLPCSGAVTGFDTGPANVLMNGWTARHRGEPMDRDGAWAASGHVDKALLQRLLDEPYFTRTAPKSTGRELFDLAWLDHRLEGTVIDPIIVQATLAELTAVSVVDHLIRHQPATRRLLVCGGGVHNTHLMDRLAFHLTGIAVESTEAYGVHPNWMEAIAFAWLAKRTLDGLPGNLPSVTGAHREVILGAIYPA
ncbi:anhydro-N-acetylmuramic acid kinase [Endothiovibrio diazotrophicus]